MRSSAPVDIHLVTPKGPASGSGNWTTADRWAHLLRESGHEATVTENWSGGETDLLLALHARRSHDSIVRFATAHPDRPLVVALTGTDLYRDLRDSAAAQESLELAWRLIVLQERGPDELSPPHRAKTRVIYQSATPLAREPEQDTFTALVLGNLRPEKDPFRAALAARLAPEESRLRVLHAGAADAEHETACREHERRSPRYRWLGQVEPRRARELLARSHALVQSSLMEGGANAVGEAIAAGLPVLASDIPGNVGMLGEDYPGYYPAGDERALAELLRRAETDPHFYAELARGVSERAPLLGVERERAALAALVTELAASQTKRRAPRYTRRMDERTRIRLTKYSTKAG